ncbi:hypothetical protein [Brevundimonas sp. NPDC058933]|uniref:hypothetical protein n=1 Tax=Brevundimonas sp. NPDC058933 TaxID=3346673 RepID=UPI003BEEF206
MDRKALFDAVRPCGPGAKLKPEWVPIIDALADAMGLPRAAGGPGKPDPELIAALKKDEGLRLKAYPDALSPRARTGKGSGAPWTIGYGRARGIQERLFQLAEQFGYAVRRSHPMRQARHRERALPA